MSGAAFGGAQIGGGPAVIDTPGSDTYQNLIGQPDSLSDSNFGGYQPPGQNPTTSPMQPTMPAAPGGKGGFAPGPQIGGGPAPISIDPNTPSAIGPQGQQPVTPQAPAGTPGGKSGGKGGFGQFGGSAAVTAQQVADFANQILKDK